MPVTNIRFINYSDGQNLAIDKINNNFDEIVESHGGSVGETGPSGDRGAIGSNGPIGSTGNDGPRGTRWFIQDLAPSSPFGSGNSVVYGDYWVNNTDSQIYQFGPSGWIDSGYSLSSSGNIFNDVDSYFTNGGTGISVKFDQPTPENCTFIISDRSPESGIINEKLAKFLISTDSAGDPSALLEFMKSDLILANPGNYALHHIDSLPGQLTATIQGESSELSTSSDLIEALTQKVGRILLNGFPTGVEVSGAMVHGGPFPSTTDSRSTSVGTQAIYRFTRPVCFQNFSSELIP